MPAHFGIDITESSIKVIEAKKDGDGYNLLAFGEAKTPYSLNSVNPDDEKIFSRTIEELLRQAKITTREVYICLSESEVYTKVIQVPILNYQELKSAIKYESEQYIPIPLNDVYLEFDILFSPPKQYPNAKMEVLLVAAKKNMVDKIVRILEEIHLSPLVMESSMLASLRALSHQFGNNTIMVEIGNLATSCAIIIHGKLRQFTTLGIAGEALTQAIVQNLSLSETQARAYKHAYGLKTNELEGKIARAMTGPLNDITNQISKNIRYAENLEKNVRIEQIILSGGTALLPEFTTYLVNQFNVEVQLANPFNNCHNKSLPKALLSAAPRFVPAVGLAIRD